MSGFPGSPRLMKGAIVGVDPFNPLASIISFQYNPDTMTRQIEAQTTQQAGERGEALRLKGAPIETISLDVEIDATDALEQGNGLAAGNGIYPQLSALEMLVYPKSSLVIANTVLLAVGTIEIIPPAAPFTLFVWGPQRVLPVRIKSFSITEEAYDVKLNPTRARVSLGLRVLSYNDLPVGHPGYALFLAHQVAKETMATLNTVGNTAGSGGLSFSGGAGSGV
jgi:Contractile injection system tube protein